MKTLITSESCNIGHPDKTCDYIADCFLDEALRQDPNAQMAVECAIKDDLLMIYGEATTTADIDYSFIANKALDDIGYKNDFRIIQQISRQSPEINGAVVKERLAANDQGMCYGYACDETPELMPLPIMLAHKMMRLYDEFRRSNPDIYFADAKSQVTVEYEDGRPARIHTALLSVSHSDLIRREVITADMRRHIIDPVLIGRTLSPDVPETYVGGCGVPVDEKTVYIINPSGSFTKWGSFADSGCVGRKIIVDTYGGVGRVGGGCFSSKNATKVDRSGAYYARYAAKNVVAAGLADKCEIQVSYGIGLTEPISVSLETFGTGKLPDDELLTAVLSVFDFSPDNIIKELDLLKPIYAAASNYGHFGRDGFTWERTDKTDALIAAAEGKNAD